MAQRMRPNTAPPRENERERIRVVDLDPEAAEAARQRKRQKEAEKRRTNRARKKSQRVARGEKRVWHKALNLENTKRLASETGLDKALRHAGERYIDQLVRSGKHDLVADKEVMRRRNRQELDGAHKAYSSAMVLQCLQPLRQGVRVDTVLQSVGTATAMWMLSPQFRQQMGNYRDQIKESIEGVIRDRESRVVKKAAKAEARGTGREDLSKRLRSRLAKQERGDRCLYTAQSAALAHVALAERFYREVRAEGVDAGERSALKDRFESSINELYAMAGEDGVASQEIETEMRKVVGHRATFHPEATAIYNELAHGRYVKGPERTMTVKGSGRTVTGWVGDYKDSFAGADIESGAFSVRMPQDAAEHREALAETLAGEMNQVSTVDELDAVMTSFYAITVLHEYPEALGLPMDDREHERMQRVYSALCAMTSDGLDESAQREVFTTAFRDAVATMEAKRPDLTAQWSQHCGGDFVDRAHRRYEQFQEMAEGINYEDVMAEPVLLDEEEEQAQEQTSQPESETEMPQPRVFHAGSGPEATVEDSTAHEPAPRFQASRSGVRDQSVDAEDVVDVQELDLGDTDTLPRIDAFGDPQVSGSVLSVLSEVVARDVAGAGSQEDFRTALSVWSSRATALGSYDPGLDSALVIGEVPHNHRPWLDDEAANERALEMMSATRLMQRHHIPAAAQDSLCAAAYVRGLEQAVEREPDLLPVITAMTVAAGGDAKNWRAHQYDAALANSITGGLNADYADVLALTGAVDEPAVEVVSEVQDDAETTRVREHLSQRIKPSQAKVENARRATARANTHYRNARISQEYNQGEGKDAKNVTPLQDVDFEMGG